MKDNQVAVGRIEIFDECSDVLGEALARQRAFLTIIVVAMPEGSA